MSFLDPNVYASHCRLNKGSSSESALIKYKKNILS
jgi:hypothetical protein